MMIFGMDFIGPIFPVGVGGKRYILIGVDYFTKFLFATSLTEATAFPVGQTFLYLWSPIVGWPWQTYTDNRSHFRNEVLRTIFEAHETEMAM